MADPQCPFCDAALTTEITRRMQACPGCADKIGIIPMPPPRRPRSPCARCNGWQFLRVIPREHSTVRMNEMNAQISAPMYVTHAPAAHRGWILKHVKELEIEKAGLGLLETYICRKCGAVEWYCADAEHIPVHPHLMTELLDYESDSPYR